MNDVSSDGVARIVVVGGGFSGAAFVLHLVRDHPGLTVDIAVVEPRERLAEGLAYSTTSPQHRINVSAARMAMFAEAPEDFDDWFHDGGHAALDVEASVPGVGAFPTREDFARYVRDRLRAALAKAPGVRFRHIVDRAIHATRRGGGFSLGLQSGETCFADLVVLATGHAATEPPSALRGLAGDPGFIGDPWSTDRIEEIGAQERVTIVGAGLTMADVLATLRANGHRAPVTAVSRRGLLPRPRTRMPVTPTGRFDEPPSQDASALLGRVRAAIRAGSAEGRPWEDVFDAVRAQGRAIWSQLSPEAKRRLLRHVGPFWDVHRYQCSPQIDSLLRGELARGTLTVIAASLLSAERDAAGLRLHLHPRGQQASARRALVCDRIIACTGPGRRSAIARNPLLSCLADAGLIKPDEYGLGIAVNDRAETLDIHGSANPTLLVVGPPARGAWGELMGLPQVSAQPREIAAAVARRLTDNVALTGELPA